MPGQWGTISLEIPDFLEKIRKTINDVAEFLVSILDIMLAILQLAKVFLIGFLDPLVAMVQIIIDEIESLLRDLRQLGLYLTGDWGLFEDPEQLLGGFAEYERRMIGRLTDRTDPNRPDVSSETMVFALFFYLSVDLSEVYRLIQAIQQMAQFFSLKFSPSSGMAVPVLREVKYGLEAATILQPKSLAEAFKWSDSPPDLAQVQWNLSNPQKGNTMVPFPPSLPGGFMVTVSTQPEPLRLRYDRAQGGASEQDASSGDKKVSPREYGKVLALGAPVLLYGGDDHIEKNPGFAYNKNVDQNGVPIKNTPRVYAMTPDNKLVPVEELKQGDKYIFQRTFWVSPGMTTASFMGGQYNITLKLDDMPEEADIEEVNGQIKLKPKGKAAAYYVRVASCSKEIAGKTKAFKYDFAKMVGAESADQPFEVSFRDEGAGSAAVSTWSATKRVVFPNASTKEYLQSVQTALVVLTLARADLKTLDEIEPLFSEEYIQQVKDGKILQPNLALQRTGLESIRHLIGVMYQDIAAECADKTHTPLSFRRSLYDKAFRLATDLYDKTGAMPEVEKYVADNTKELRETTWAQVLTDQEPFLAKKFLQDYGDPTLLDAVDPGHDKCGGKEDWGIAASPFGLGLSPERVNDFFFVRGVGGKLLIRHRKPHFAEVTVGDAGALPVKATLSSEDATALMASNPAARLLYAGYVQEDGSVKVPPESLALFDNLKNNVRVSGSGDLTPVIYYDKDNLESIWKGSADALDDPLNPVGIMYCRSLLGGYQGGVLFSQARVALGIAAGSFMRPQSDSEWVAIRLFDSFPDLEVFLDSLLNWIDAVRKSLESIVDTIKRYIEFVEARIVELQQLIRRINSLIQGILGYTFQIPKMSALLLTSTGTGGLLADLVSADQKPSDSPLAYGAGLAVVIPFGPSIVMDFVTAFFKPDAGSEPVPQMTKGIEAPLIEAVGAGDAVGLEAMPPVVLVAPDPEPDPL